MGSEGRKGGRIIKRMLGETARSLFHLLSETLQPTPFFLSSLLISQLVLILITPLCLTVVVVGKLFSWISMRSGFVRVAVNKRRRRSNRIIRRILTRKPFLWWRVCSVFLVFFSFFFFLSFFHLGFVTALYIVSSSNSNFPRLARKFVQAFFIS